MGPSICKARDGDEARTAYFHSAFHFRSSSPGLSAGWFSDHPSCALVAMEERICFVNSGFQVFLQMSSWKQGATEPSDISCLRCD